MTFSKMGLGLALTLILRMIEKLSEQHLKPVTNGVENLVLSNTEEDDIVAFLKSVTDAK